MFWTTRYYSGLPGVRAGTNAVSNTRDFRLDRVSGQNDYSRRAIIERATNDLTPAREDCIASG